MDRSVSVWLARAAMVASSTLGATVNLCVDSTRSLYRFGAPSAVRRMRSSRGGASGGLIRGLEAHHRGIQPEIPPLPPQATRLGCGVAEVVVEECGANVARRLVGEGILLQ